MPICGMSMLLNAMAKIAWDDLTFPKYERGLGLIKIHDQNKTDIMRLIWNPSVNAESI